MRAVDYLKDEYHKERHWALGPRSERILTFFVKYVDKNDTILELGCSSGRNLVYLNQAGYKNLTGLEMYPVAERPEFKLIKGRWEEVELDEYDVMFSASFLQEFQGFIPKDTLRETLKKCKKYFMIFGDAVDLDLSEYGFSVVERAPTAEPFSQPIVIYKRND